MGSWLRYKLSFMALPLGFFFLLYDLTLLHDCEHFSIKRVLLSSLEQIPESFPVVLLVAKPSWPKLISIE